MSNIQHIHIVNTVSCGRGDQKMCPVRLVQQKMTRAVLASLGFLALSAGAWAADVASPPLKAPPPPPGFSWTGFYFGGHVGWADQSYSNTTFDGTNGGVVDQFNLQSKGAFGGAQFGYNWVIAPSILLGIEADGSVAALKGTASACSASGNNAGECSAYQYKTNDLGTVRGRVGYFWNNLLLYGTGGWAWSTNRYNRAVTSAPLLPALTSPNADGSQTGSSNGWAIGAGIEWGFAPRWTLRVEYLHTEFSGVTNNYDYIVLFPPPLIINRTTQSTLDSDMVRIGLNFFLTP
jgi:outer membrane immunogenic protein